MKVTDKIDDSVQRLGRQLPLLNRQQALPPGYADIHRAILRALATTGRPLDRSEIAAMLPDGDVDDALARLGGDDLVVLSSDGKEAVGAYPMTTEDTPHQLDIAGVEVNAMCALDALAVGPMFDAGVDVESRCHVTDEPIQLRVEGDRIVSATPSADVRVGIAWQQPCGHAAHSMCREMIFLVDGKVARAWQGGDTDAKTVFTLDEALDFAGRFFRPLVT
jgi:mercuric reductase